MELPFVPRGRIGVGVVLQQDAEPVVGHEHLDELGDVQARSRGAHSPATSSARPSRATFRLPQPQRNVRGLHGVVDHGQQVGPHRVQVHLVAQARTERG